MNHSDESVKILLNFKYASFHGIITGLRIFQGSFEYQTIDAPLLIQII